MIFKYLFIIGIVIALVIIVVKIGSPHNRSLELYWGIEMPADFKEVYYTSIVGFHGDGFRYTIFDTRNNAHLSFIKVFNNQRNKTVEDFIDRVINELDVPEDKSPSIKNQSYFWWIISGDRYYGNTLVIVFMPKDGKYYFLEEFY